MLPAIWRNEACMNIEVNTVSQAGSVFAGATGHRSVRQQLAVAEDPDRLRARSRPLHELGAVLAGVRQRVRGSRRT